MATLVRVNVTDPQNVLDTYGAGALIRIERDTTSAMTGAAELDTIAVVATQTEYEYQDPDGVAGTHWYQVRYSTASPAVAADLSGYSAPFQAGAASGEVITLEAVKAWNGVSESDTADDKWSPIAIAAINRAGIHACGIDLGPSPDTTRTYDASRVARDGTRLYIPGGIRAFLTVATGDGSTWTTITSSVRIGPLSHSRPAGEPGSYIEVTPGQSVRLDASYFVRITATAFAGFGWDAWPMDLVQDALAAYQRLALDRASGGKYPTEIAAMRYLHLPLWHSYRDRYFPRVR